VSSIPEIKIRVENLYKENPNIRMNVAESHPRVIKNSAEAKIIGVYPHTFRIVEHSEGYARFHTIKYSDILIGKIEIIE